MLHVVKDKMQNIDEITDFGCFRTSALEKLSLISKQTSELTIGSSSSDSKELENIENEQNSCNVDASRKSRSPQNGSSTAHDIKFSFNKIISENELQRKEKVQKAKERHLQNMKESEKAIRERMESMGVWMAHKREQKWKKELADLLAEENRKAEEQQLHAQRLQEQREKLEKEMELKLRLTALKNEFEAKYKKISLLAKSCKDKNFSVAILAAVSKEIHKMEALEEEIKTKELVSTDVSSVELLVHQIEGLLSFVRTEIEKINASYDANVARSLQNAKEAQVEHEIPKQQSENTEIVSETNASLPVTSTPEVVGNNDQTAKPQADLQTAKPVDSAHSVQEISTPVTSSQEITSQEPTSVVEEVSLSEYVSKESLEIYTKSQQLLESYTQSYKEFLQSASTKKFRFECQKAINIPINAISAVSEQHLRDKYERLQSLLVGKSTPNITQYPQGVMFCKDILAKKIVNQGDTLVSSKPKMAFSIAAVAVALWQEHADFGELLLAYFHTICPFTVPVFMPQRVGQSNEDYYRSLGYKYSEDGTIEKQDKFLKRMSGLMRLYASIIITSPRKGVSKTHPHGLQNAWRWLASVLNVEPRPEISDVCATLILDMLEVAGNSLWTAYPKQFHKLLMILINEYYPRMQNTGGIGGGPLVRLEEFLKNTLAKGSIPRPEGQLSPNFW